MADLDGNVTSCNELIPLNCLPATGRLVSSFIALWRHLAKTQLLSFIHIVQIDLSITQLQKFTNFHEIRSWNRYETGMNNTVISTGIKLLYNTSAIGLPQCRDLIIRDGNEPSFIGFCSVRVLSVPGFGSVRVLVNFLNVGF